MSSKMQFQVFYGEYNVMYGLNGVDLSAFKCTSSGIDKPLERSFGSICKWLQRGFHVDPETHGLRHIAPGESGESLGSARSFRCPPRWSVSVARTTGNYE